MHRNRVHDRFAAILAAATLFTSAGLAPAALAHPVDPAVSTADYGKLALAFEPNHGQTDASVDFLARGRGYSLFLTPAEAVLVLADTSARNDEQGGHVLRVQLEGGNPRAAVSAGAELPGKVNHLIGNDPAQWQTDVPTYARVAYEEVYPGVEVNYHGQQGQLEYDFIVAPGADPAGIHLGFEGADDVVLDGAGDLILHTPAGDIREPRPLVYQDVDGRRDPIAGAFSLSLDHHVGFLLGDYDRSRPLVIDPTVLYSTYLGGSGDENYWGGVSTSGIAVDSSGSAYVVGSTTSAMFPVSKGAVQPTFGNTMDVFVAKLNPAGSALMYSTYLGGLGWDMGTAIAVDRANYAYVTGMTNSDTTFPRVKAYQNTFGGGAEDAFVAKLNQTGTALEYSTFLGGNGQGWAEGGYGIGVDGNFNAHVTGVTNSPNFPMLGAAQPALGGLADTFVTTLNAGGSALVYSTFLGGAEEDLVRGLAVDRLGNTYITGNTKSDGLASSPSVFQPTRNPSASDAFVAKYSPSGSRLYFTYLGGGGDDFGFGIGVDSAGSAYVAGGTGGTFYITPNFFNATCLDSSAFIAKLNATATALEYSGCLGAPGKDAALGLAVDRAGNAYVTGFTESPEFPMVDAFQTKLNGQRDAFVAKLNATGGVLVYSSFLGGGSVDGGLGIAVDYGGHAYVTGYTASLDFPTTNPLQPAFGGGGWDGFVAKIDCDV